MGPAVSKPRVEAKEKLLGGGGWREGHEFWQASYLRVSSRPDAQFGDMGTCEHTLRSCAYGFEDKNDITSR